MAEKKGEYKRKVKLIKIKFQMRFIIIILLLMFLTGMVVSWGTYCLDRAIVNQLVEVDVFRVLLTSWVLLLIVIGVGLSILVSHRVAGPIYRFEKIFDKLMGGNLNQKVFLRKEDELQELSEKLNCVIKFMRDEIVKERENVELISKEIEMIDESISKKSSGSEEFVKMSNSLKDIKERIKKINTAFTV
ncbi:methyl-accepting chemotaxis protein [bacterium]|nr:methyl-accepting chemotaxis protein [bacterium]